MTGGKERPAAFAGAPHYLGHRERLRTRFAEAGGPGVADYELLELILLRSIPRRDVKPIAKALMARFGSFAEVIGARPERLVEIEGVAEATSLDLKIIEEAARRFAKGSVSQRQPLSSWGELIGYCRTAMAFSDREEFRILFLDKRNALIADEIQGEGTVDHTPVYPREIVRRALELGATAVILAHNYPFRDPFSRSITNHHSYSVTEHE